MSTLTATAKDIEGSIERPDDYGTGVDKAIADMLDQAPVVRDCRGASCARRCGMRASDVHIEPRAEDVQVRFRVDGSCRPTTDAVRTCTATSLSRIKILAE